MPRFLVLLALIALCLPATGADPLRLAVAANFRATAEELGKRYRQATGTDVTISSAATGVLYSQLRHGAPFDLFLAADSQRPRLLGESGDGIAASRRCYARGRLVLLGDAPLLARLAEPGRSVAIANPETAPYGIAAAEVLARPPYAGVQRRLVRGASVLQAYQFYASGAVDLALVARSLVPAGESVTLVPAAWHAPIEQHAIVIAASPRQAVARDFLAFLHRDDARAQLLEAGYEPCP
jgi:molybdate transport system substrate-binding protein